MKNGGAKRGIVERYFFTILKKSRKLNFVEFRMF